MFYNVYDELGIGFIESVYERAMEIALAEAGLAIERQPRLEAYFRGFRVGDFRPAFVVQGHVIVELKAGRMLEPSHAVQLLNYLRCSQVEVGLLLNFGTKTCFRRLLFTNDHKRSHRNNDDLVTV